MRFLYVVTHPEATHHVERVVGGWHDSTLTSAGKNAAAAIARTLRAEIPIGTSVELVSSDLLRTSQTADEIAALFGLETILEPRLREKSYGEAEGRPQQWQKQRFIPPPALCDRMNHHEGIQGAETRGECARRVYAAMEEILGRDCEHQIIVTHGGALTFVVAAWIEMPFESLGSVRFCGSPGSITRLRQDDFYRNREVVHLADTRHLDAANSTIGL
ncbi:histidine phosphatase family protein [Actinospica durhamensis]|uniref:Histidine phosphatase family protein n=1 Tax=Actinospica durhamensis TaxID=1508375 RepID=A0A941EX93_9ACTN|nr:histidine phosphatase family protein [Actinospica durhamensis]MBR7835624.1 histidine phosphatase family protein [Actinospica durhamensis]